MSLSLEPLNKPALNSTRGRLIEVSGELFAERGFDSVSLRMITESANANLAAVNYHFGSKEELILAVVEDIVGPVNEKRLEQLGGIDFNSTNSLKAIIHAFIDPVFDVTSADVGADNKYYKLISRCIASRDERVSSIIIRQFPEVLARFVSSLTRAIPGLSSDSAHLKVMFMAGALAHSLFHYENLLLASGGSLYPSSLNVLKSELVSFLTAGMSSN
ncbi:MAG: TetR/AcrR family transcriptional regulator [Verrucomicrobia bacterium]|nr:MAG: TetR/AcrR family transcriptional regulator [Verrucomicrobiota bacterium]